MQIIYSNESLNEGKNKYILTHWQKGMELLRITSGKMECLVDGKVFELYKGDICIINENQLHRIYPDDKCECMYQCLMIDSSLFTNNKEIYDLYIKPILEDEHFTHIITRANKPFTKELNVLLDAIYELDNTNPKAKELLIVAYMHMLLQKIYTYYKEKSNDNVDISFYDLILYRKLADYIYDNYKEKITLEELSKYGSISRNKCCALFKKYAQNSPIDFINLHRLEVSINLLENTDESISAIAFDCGFGQQSYYNRLFLKRYGMTPKEYRNKKKK